jgi:predicted dithiol-disulfide oxidoreductase (DUF899 family)
MAQRRVVGYDAWVEARTKHLAKEKEFTRLRDQLSRERRELPWELVTQEYVFEGERGAQALGDLFDGRGQLVVYHAMFDPATAGPRTTWTTDAPCFSCSFWMDNFNGVTVHLIHRDVSMVAVWRAPYVAIAAYRERMGWSFPRYSSSGSDFNRDFHVSFSPEELASGKVEYDYHLDTFSLSEAPGASVFVKDDQGQVFHTYSTYARGLDMLNVAYHYMDFVSKGRDEGDRGQSWVRRRDEYAD